MSRVSVHVVGVRDGGSVGLLVVVVGLGLKAAVTPLGSVEGDRVTLPVKPFCGETVMVLEPLLPWVTVRIGRASCRERVCVAATARLGVVVFVGLAEVPVIVRVIVL